MKIKFIEWIEDQSVPNDAKNLFHEASTCYKNDAYHAALLLSYLGFQSVIKDRLVNAAKPDDFVDGEWKNIIDNIKDEDQWDSAVYDALMRKKKQIFIIKEDTRNQITYWKNRRNDCAHYKDSEIQSSHIESFWLFIKSNLSKLVVSGSLDDLLNKIRKHFDYSQTAPDQNVEYIINDISKAVDKKQYDEFLDQTFNIINSLHEEFIPEFYSDELVHFFADLFKVNENDFIKALTNYLKNNKTLLLDILFANPKYVSFFADESTFIRSLWYEILPNYHRQIYPVYCSMLGQSLIPNDQIDESIEHIINGIGMRAPSAPYIQTLKQIGFFKVFYKIAFEKDRLWNFRWSNSNKNLIVFYLKNFELDETVVACLCENFSKEKHPFELAKSLCVFFEENDLKRKKAVLIIIQNSIKEPTFIEPIVQELKNKKST